MTSQDKGGSKGTGGASVLTPEDRQRIHREVLLHSEMRPEGQGSPGRGGPGGQATAMIIRQLGSRAMVTTFIGLFGTLFTVAIATYHHYFSRASLETEVKDDVGASNRGKKVSLLSTLPNDIETSHTTLAVLQRRRIWLLSHRAPTDVDELGRKREQVADEYWQVSKAHLLGKKPAAVLTEAKVFFDSPRVAIAADGARDAVLREVQATTDEELRVAVREAQHRIESLIEAMGDEVNDSMRRPKHAGPASSSSVSPAAQGADRADRTLSIP